MKKFIYSLKQDFRSLVGKLRKISLTRWGLIVAIITGIITLAAWLRPEPLRSGSPTPVSTTVAQSLGITEQIPPRRPGTVRILVARFDEADQSSYRVTELILARLRSALSIYPDTEVLATNRVITEQDGSDTASKIGEAYNANIVIWGWYGLTDSAVPLGVHFETISNSAASSESVPGTCSAISASQIRKVNPTELSDLTLQTNLSNELAYVTIFTIGLARFGADDWAGSIEMFSDAIEQLGEDTILSAKISGNGILVETDLLYYVRALAYFNSSNNDAALADMEMIRGSLVNDPVFQFNLGQIYERKKDHRLAIDHLTKAIEKKPSAELLAVSHYLRGVAFNHSLMPEDANQDIQTAFELDYASVFNYVVTSIPLKDALSYSTELISENPNNFAAYFFRGLANKDLGNFSDSLDDYNKALEIYPDFLPVRQTRSELVGITARDPKQRIKDLNALLSSEKYRTPCNLLSMGLIYSSQGKREEANKYLDEAVLMTTKEISSFPENGSAYFVRASAYNSKGEYLQAYQDYQLAKQLGPTSDYDIERVDKNIKEIVDYYIGLAILIIVTLIVIILFGVVLYPLVKFRLAHSMHYRKAKKKPHANRP